MNFVAMGLAGIFVAFSGRNDGGALLAAGITKSNRRQLGLSLIAVVALVVAPMVLGTKVATTLIEGIVEIEGRFDLVIIVVATTTAIVAISTKFGLATSIGLALVGALAGAGVGAGLPVDGGGVGRVLLLGAASPVVASLLGRATSVFFTAMPFLRSIRRSANNLRWWTYPLLCLAYGANDGQKALAVIALAAGASLTSTSQVLVIAIVSAALFLGGMLIGAKQVAVKIGRGMTRTYPIEIATADLVASSVVVAGASLGTPLSLTQAITGATVGVTSRTGWNYVRWPILGRTVAAWVLTFPVTALIAGVISKVVN
ncbi:MAG: inorganic phosphate transporter [Acidimicrobiia bacterium]